MGGSGHALRLADRWLGLYGNPGGIVVSEAAGPRGHGPEKTLHRTFGVGRIADKASNTAPGSDALVGEVARHASRGARLGRC